MQNTARPFAVAMATTTLLASCGGEPKRAVGPTPNLPLVASIEITGPASIAPGQSAQFTAIAHLTDGTARPATDVRWSTRSRLIRVDAAGVATAGEQMGEDTLSAEATSAGMSRVVRSLKEVIIVPDGTFRMVGGITENGSPETPVAGARIEVISNTSIAAVTNFDGQYRLYGVPHAADIRITRDGYRPHLQSFQLSEHVTQNFELTLAAAALNLAGPYTLSLDATCATSTPVSGDFRHRSYAALITQRGSVLEVGLTESSRFRVNTRGRGDRFSGRADPVGAAFDLGSSFFPYYAPYDPSTYPNLVENLPNGTFLAVDGTVQTTGSAAELSGDLWGFFTQFDSRFPAVLPSQGSTLGTCYSLTHRFTLTRR
jgi:hypothetical protein